MKKIPFLFLLIFSTQFISYSQLPVYYFNTTTDTAYENNANIITGYIKTNISPSQPDSVYIILKSGPPRSTHMDTTSIHKIYFAAGQDSVPFLITIYKDTFPEYPENVMFVIQQTFNGSAIGSDSTLLFVLIDSTPPATITFIVDSIWCYEGSDSFYNGANVPFQSTANVAILVNNPNPFYIRYYTDYYGCNTPSYPDLTACGLTDFFYNGETCYAAPGITTFYKTAYMNDLNRTNDIYFMCYLKNLDANTILDTFIFFTIKHNNYFDTPTLAFDVNSITVVGDSFQSIAIPITISNPNRKPLYFRIDTTQSSSVYPGINYTFNNQEYGYGNGISHDTFWVNFIKPYLTGDTISMVFALRNDSVNASPDTLLSITAIDTGGANLFVSFLGAGLSHLKSDSIGYVKVYNSSIAKFPMSVKVSYLNGDAIRDTDFIFNDTTVTFTPYLYDTISLPVIMLQDHRRQANTQVNLQLNNISPATVQYGITQYSYIIIDNEDSALTTGFQALTGNQNMAIYPNPTQNTINIHTNLTQYSLIITNTLGQEVYKQTELKGNQSIDIATLQAGIYFFKVNGNSATYTAKVLKITP